MRYRTCPYYNVFARFPLTCPRGLYHSLCYTDNESIHESATWPRLSVLLTSNRLLPTIALARRRTLVVTINSESLQTSNILGRH